MLPGKRMALELERRVAMRPADRRLRICLFHTAMIAIARLIRRLRPKLAQFRRDHGSQLPMFSVGPSGLGLRIS